MNILDIRTARKKAGLTQEQLAKKIGVNRATLSKYESGLIEPSFSQVENIAKALGVDLIELADPFIATSLKSAVGENWESENEIIRKRYGIEGNFVVVETEDEDITKLMQLFTMLNDEGQREALRYIEIIAGNPNFQRIKAQEQPKANTEHLQTEKPPQGNQTPHDGK